METDKTVLSSISPLSFSHPTDQAAMLSLSKVPGIDRVLKFAFRLIHERRARLHFLSSAVRVNERQFPELHAQYMEACKVLDIETIPELYVSQDPMPNAFAYGVDKPFIVVRSSIMDLLSPKEVQAVLGHELGHIMAGHMLYYSILIAIINVLQMGGLGIPFGNLGLRAFVVALFEWYRKAELTCDRAALLASQDVHTCHTTQMKLAGGPNTDQMNLDEFFAQADEYEQQDDLLDSIYKILNNWNTTHPRPVARLRELQRWVDSGDYQKILDGDYIRRDDNRHQSAAAAWIRAAKQAGDEASKKANDATAGFLDEVGKFGENLKQSSNDWVDRILSKAEQDIEDRRKKSGDDDDDGDGLGGKDDLSGWS